jgi:hypothetical protein
MTTRVELTIHMFDMKLLVFAILAAQADHYTYQATTLEGCMPERMAHTRGSGNPRSSGG